MTARIDLATLCTCGHFLAEHRETGECNPCGASGVGEDAYPNCAKFESVADQQPVMLPKPGDGCACSWYNEDRGGGYFEAMQEYDPACPVHSEHVYNPRTGVWELALPNAERLAEILHDTLGCTVEGCSCASKSDYYLSDAPAILALLRGAGR